MPRTPCLMAPRKSSRRRWKKWPGIGHAHDGRARLDLLRPVEDRRGATISSLSPWISNHGQAGGITPVKSRRPTGGRDADHLPHRQLPRRLQGDPGAEGKTAQPQCVAGDWRPCAQRATASWSSTSPRPSSNWPSDCADAAEVEANHGQAQFGQRPRRHRHHLVVHGAALGRVGMAKHDEALPRMAGLGKVDGHFQLAHDTRNQQGGAGVGEARWRWGRRTHGAIIAGSRGAAGQRARSKPSRIGS